jgi:hypothetical protein
MQKRQPLTNQARNPESGQDAPAAETGRTDPVLSPAGPADLMLIKKVSTTPMVGRVGEQAELRARLLDDSGGILVVKGEPGVGKSSVVKAVLDELEKPLRGQRGQAGPQILRYDAAPDSRMHLDALIADMQGLLNDDARFWGDFWCGASQLHQFKATLEALGEKPVVSAFDSAEHMLNPETQELLDTELDQAFELPEPRDRQANRRQRGSVAGRSPGFDPQRYKKRMSSSRQCGEGGAA